MPRAFTSDERVRIDRHLKRAATDALHGGGLRHTSVARLAKAAGISKGAFYLFFPNKETLAMALLLDAERELREELWALAVGPDALRPVLETLFRSLRSHPSLALLSDPEEFAWLTRSLGEGALRAAAQDDDAWFRSLYARLHAYRAVRDADPTAFLGLPRAALALAQHADELGPDPERTLAAVIDGLVVTLRPS